MFALLQATSHPQLHMSTLEYEAVSDPFELFDVDVQGLLDGTRELASFGLRRDMQVGITHSASLHALLYWFDFEMSPTVKVDSLNGRGHWQQAAVILVSKEDEISVEKDSTIDIRVFLRDNCIFAQVTKHPSH